MTSTVTAATAAAFGTNLIDKVGQIIIFSLILLLIYREYLPLFIESSALEREKRAFLMRLPDLAIPSFLFVFTYIIVFHALEVLN